MQYQAKLLRRNGVRLADALITAAPWVVVEVVTWKGPGGKRLRMYRTNTTLAVKPEPVRELFKCTVDDMSHQTVTFFGMERCLTGEGVVAAVAQEWLLMRVTIGPGGWPEARERNITDDTALL